jgi:hypothetical protein
MRSREVRKESDSGRAFLGEKTLTIWWWAKAGLDIEFVSGHTAESEFGAPIQLNCSG